MARRRSFNIFSLSFLDVMACGLGATILFLMIIGAQVRNRAEAANESLLAQAASLEKAVAEARDDAEAAARERAAASGGSTAAADAAREIERLRALIADLSAQTEARQDASLARKESIEQLRSDVQRLEEANRRLAEMAPNAGSGERIRSFVGRGNRQYLTGMKVGGTRVLILVDASASMLGRTYANVVRFRAMSDEDKVRAPKWKQTLATVDWLGTHLAPGSRFQIIVFNEQARSVVDGTEGTWLATGDLDRAMTALRGVVPEKGTSLYRAFEAARGLKPAPDNIYLITDGLPTQGSTAPSAPEQVRADRRAKYLQQAQPLLPPKVAVNVLLLPMEGDPAAPFHFWRLAAATRGSFLSPSVDWP